jgi:cell division septum initiation protein DivIVA
MEEFFNKATKKLEAKCEELEAKCKEKEKDCDERMIEYSEKWNIVNAENESLKAENESLKAENESLKAENAKKPEKTISPISPMSYNRLAKENTMLNEKIDALKRKIPGSAIVEENLRLKEELKEAKKASSQEAESEIKNLAQEDEIAGLKKENERIRKILDFSMIGVCLPLKPISEPIGPESLPKDYEELKKITLVKEQELFGLRRKYDELYYKEQEEREDLRRVMDERLELIEKVGKKRDKR